METIQEQYNAVAEKMKAVQEQITELAASEQVKKYFELQKQKDSLKAQEKSLYQKLKINRYESCQHLWIKTVLRENSYDGDHTFYGCIKCGLDQSVLNVRIDGPRDQINWLLKLERDNDIMYDFILTHPDYFHGTVTDSYGDLELSKAIYSRIKETHPNIDDDTAVRYLEWSLDNIEKHKVSKERKEGRAKRLSLKPEFNGWPCPYTK